MSATRGRHRGKEEGVNNGQAGGSWFDSVWEIDDRRGELGKEFVAGEWGQTLGRSVVAMVPESGLGSKVTEGGLV